MISDKYHLFHDREKIESYLREGYKKYHTAKNIFDDPEIAILRKKTTLTMKNINYIISSYSDVYSSAGKRNRTESRSTG